MCSTDLLRLDLCREINGSHIVCVAPILETLELERFGVFYWNERFLPPFQRDQT